MRNKEWRLEAACRGADTSIFFQGRGYGPKLYAEARSYCDRCPVLADCFEFIMEVESDPANKPRCGIFGGMTPRERDEYQAKRDAYAAV